MSRTPSAPPPPAPELAAGATVAPIVVTGATGRIGGLVRAALVAAGVPVRATFHRAQPDGPPGAWVPLDWTSAASPAAEAALDGAGALFLMLPEQLPDPSAAAARLLAAASARGVRRVVLLSALGVEAAGAETGMTRIEAAARAAAPDVTILRPNTFMQNFEAGPWAGPLARDGAVIAPCGDARVSFVDLRDVAAVAAARLLEPPALAAAARCEELVLTGGEALSFADAAAHLGRALGRPVRYVDPGPAAYAAQLAALGLPPPAVHLIGRFMAALASGAHAVVAGEIARVTGRPPRTFEAFARELAARGPARG